MSLGAAKAFLLKIATEEDAADKARSAHEEALTRLGHELGFEFSADDLRNATDDLEDMDELTSEQLDRVAGGVGRRGGAGGARLDTIFRRF